MQNTDNFKHSEISEKIIKAFYKDYNTLGYGFLEKMYKNAMFVELTSIGLFVEKQKHEGKEVGECFADLAIEKCVIVELKSAECLCEEHEFQLIN